MKGVLRRCSVSAATSVLRLVSGVPKSPMSDMRNVCLYFLWLIATFSFLTLQSLYNTYEFIIETSGPKKNSFLYHLSVFLKSIRRSILVGHINTAHVFIIINYNDRFFYFRSYCFIWRTTSYVSSFCFCKSSLDSLWIWCIKSA